MLQYPFPDSYFKRQDNSDDERFYTMARKVVHIDDHAIKQVKAHFRALLPPGGAYLDLMSSWRSHLPDELNPSEVVGLGMNADEMADNPQLSRYVVHNLNRNPALHFDDAAFDAAFCTVSVQYLTQPIEVFTEVARVLRPGAPFIVTFSNRCFPSKAVSVWLSTTDNQHIALVTTYFEQTGLWTGIQADVQRGVFKDPLYAVWGRRAE